MVVINTAAAVTDAQIVEVLNKSIQAEGEVKKRPGGMMHFGTALEKMWDLLRGEATDAEIEEYDAAIRK